MGKAGQYACNAAATRGEMSYSTAATVGERWGQFVEWAREQGINKMEAIDRDAVIEYGRELAERVSAGEMSPAYAQNLVSAVNSVMSIATGGAWESVSPTKDCNIAERSHVREDAPGALDREVYSRALDAVRSEVGERAAAVVELCRELGLRSKEASLLDARAALREAESRGVVTIVAGTKGGREREIPITSERQIEALQRAAEAQGRDHSMIPSDQSWREWREGTLRDAREVVQEHTGGGLHDLRAAYACERYEALTGHAAPVAGGEIADRDADREARLTIAEELGHGRIDVVSEYIGGR
jgi:site-specific recombinase XerD